MNAGDTLRPVMQEVKKNVSLGESVEVGSFHSRMGESAALSFLAGTMRPST